MAANRFNLSSDFVINSLTVSVHQELERMLRIEFQKHADEIIQEASRSVMTELSATINSYATIEGTNNLMLTINHKPIDLYENLYKI